MTPTRTRVPESMNLRDELLGATTTVPEYALVRPSGWAEYDASDESERTLTRLAADRLRQQHRPDLNAQLRSLTARAFAGMRGANTHRIYLQTEGWADELVLPLSITAAVRTAPGGGSLDGMVTDLVRTGATSLHGDKRFVRWESASSVAVGTATMGQRTAAYLTPFPDRRTHALQFTAVAVHPLDDPRESWRPTVERMLLLTDAVVSTFAWRRA